MSLVSPVKTFRSMRRWLSAWIVLWNASLSACMCVLLSAVTLTWFGSVLLSRHGHIRARASCATQGDAKVSGAQDSAQERGDQVEAGWACDQRENHPFSNQASLHSQPVSSQLLRGACMRQAVKRVSQAYGSYRRIHAVWWFIGSGFVLVGGFRVLCAVGTALCFLAWLSCSR